MAFPKKVLRVVWCLLSEAGRVMLLSHWYWEQPSGEADMPSDPVELPPGHPDHWYPPTDEERRLWAGLSGGEWAGR